MMLKGIDMPKEGTIKLEIEPNGMVFAEGEDWQSYTESAIQIPKDHGRLGDLDYLYDRFKANKCPDENVYRLIREEPTILEAEGEK